MKTKKIHEFNAKIKSNQIFSGFKSKQNVCRKNETSSETGWNRRHDIWHSRTQIVRFTNQTAGK